MSLINFPFFLNTYILPLLLLLAFIWSLIIKYNFKIYIIKLFFNKEKKNRLYLNQFKVKINQKWNIFFINSINISIFFVFCFIIYYFIITENNLEIVTENTNINQNFFFKICSLWSNHAGSFLLWIVLLKILSILFEKTIPLTQFSIKNIWFFIYGWISFYILNTVFFTSNPLITLTLIKKTGNELNPLLQDILLLIHPPILYVGYISTFFLFLIIILKITYRNIKNDLNHFLILFNNISFMFLTFGIFLGGFWAYHELGWGGWWFWDPVENISIIPWIISLIIIHILNLKPNIHLNTVFLINLLVFNTIFNTLSLYIVRTGLLTSIHMFVSDNFRGVFLLSIFNIFLIKTLLLNNLFYLTNTNARKHFSNIILKNFIINLGIVIGIIITSIIFLGTLIPIFIIKSNIIKAYFYISLISPFIIILFFLLTFLQKSFMIIKYISFISIIFILSSLNLNSWSFLTFLIIAFFIFNKNIVKNKAHLSFYILGFYIIFLKDFEFEFLKITTNSDYFSIFTEKMLLRNINFLENLYFNSNIANILNESFFFRNNNTNVLFTEKKYFWISNIYTSKGSIYSNIIYDLHFYLGSGNLYQGWLLKIKMIPFVFWFWVLIFIIIKFIFQKLNYFWNSLLYNYELNKFFYLKII